MGSVAVAHGADETRPGSGSERFRVAVIGAGPAGCAAAIRCAAAGADTLLVERAALGREKPCGGCLNAEALARLDALGVSLPRSARLDALELRVRGRSARLPLDGSRALPRSALDGAMARRAREAGATVYDRTAARLVDAALGRVELRSEAGGAIVVAERVILAGGLAGVGRDGAPAALRAAPARGSRFGASATLAPVGPEWAGAIWMGVGAGGYAGLARYPDGALHVGAALDPGAARAAGGPGPLCARILADSGISPPSDLCAARFRGTPLLTRRATRPAAAGILATGDRAAYGEPFTGEGIAWALRTGAAAAERALRGKPEGDARAWPRRHRGAVGLAQARCRTIALVLRRPRLAAAATRLLRASPGLAARLGPVFHGRLRPKGTGIGRSRR